MIDAINGGAWTVWGTWIDVRGVWPILVWNGGLCAIQLRGAKRTISVEEALQWIA